MPTPARLLNVFLLLALLGVGSYAFWEHRLRESLSADLDALAKERADLRKQLWASKPASSPGLAAHPATQAERDQLALENGVPADVRNQRVGDMVNRFTNLMDSPEAQRLMGIQQKAALDARYSSLFKSLHLTPEQLDKFKSLLVEKQNAVMDVMAAARAQGLNPRDNRDQIAQLIQGTQAEVDSTIRSTLGEDAYSQYQTYEKTLPQRNTVGQLQARLSYTDQPLTTQQSEQMVSLLASNTTGGNRPTGGGVAARLGGMANAGGTAAITDTAVNQAQTVLTAPQLQALQQLQQEQQAQAKLGQLMRSLRAGGGATGTGTTATPPPTPPKG
jgi:hypothetical protein